MVSIDEIIKISKEVAKDNGIEIEINEKTSFLGGESSLDSMALVQLCIALEEKSNELNFNFDWTSEKAMSLMKSVFKNPITICEEFNKQFKESNK